jgi:pilus assembly protein Flp/PilA
MQRWMARLRRDQSGQAMVEYGLILGLVALVVAGAIYALSGGLGTLFGHVSNCVSNASSTCATGSTSTSGG